MRKRTKKNCRLCCVHWLAWQFIMHKNCTTYLSPSLFLLLLHLIGYRYTATVCLHICRCVSAINFAKRINCFLISIAHRQLVLVLSKIWAKLQFSAIAVQHHTMVGRAITRKVQTRKLVSGNATIIQQYLEKGRENGSWVDQFHELQLVRCSKRMTKTL